MNLRTLDLGPDRWARAERLFDTVADMPPEERSAYLVQVCADDAELRAYVESLADSDVAGDSVIEDSIRQVLALAVPEEAPGDVVGERVGPYRIVRVLGSGGMGVVYLAERADEQFRQQVAIKLVRQRLVDPEIEERLVGERQILANLQHPNIARLFDGGTTTDGTPYLVMEYIDGVPIDDYCDMRCLNINERLELFRTICSAVHYAHQNLIVHRDIKASNILVTADGTPKLLDFGIAKLLDAGGAATDGLTRQGVLMMTPENAAPEQVLERPVTTATDTYALGVLLYRLLCGHPPYRIGGRKPREMAEIICERQPLPPSAMVNQELPPSRPPEPFAARQAPEAISRRRGSDPERLARRLRGDLDNIVLAALRKEPTRRYRSVSELSEDIRLHLASLPVHARAATWSYRTGKFLRRHTAGAAMSALLVVLLIAFGAVMTVQNQRIAQERDTAEEVSTFLEEIFMAPDPGNARGLDVTAKDILAAGARKISAELSGRPHIQATLMQTIGRVYFNLGEYEPSIAMLEASLAIRRHMYGEWHREVASAKNELAASLIRVAQYDRARRLLMEALETNRSLGASSTAAAANLYNLTNLAQDTGELEEAERYARESISIYESHGEPYAREIAEGKNALARILHNRNELHAAEQLYREAIAEVTEHLGEDHPLIAWYLQNLAVTLQAKGDLDAAEAMFLESMSVTRKVLGEEHDLLGGSLVMLGTLLHDRGQYDEAAQAFQDALVMHRNGMGAEHPYVAYDMTRLAMLEHDVGRLDEAESLLRDALRLFEASLGPDHQYVASALTELGAVLTDLGRYEEAETALLRAIAIRENDYEPSNPLVATTRTAYGHTLARLGRFEEAERLLVDNSLLLLDADGRLDRRTRRALSWTAGLYEAWGRPDEAGRYRRLLTSEPP
jgi:eukaryotic-like serine/threonine-protein kinase